MRILLDPQIFWTQKYGGISRMFSELYHHLSLNENIYIECPLLAHNNYHLEEKGILNCSRIYKFIDSTNFKGSGFLKNIFFNYKRYALRKIKRHNYDIFITTYYDTYFLNFIANKPFVLTVYDMIFELFPNYYNTNFEIISFKKTLLYNANTIISISNHTKNDILNLYPDIHPEIIKTVYLSHSVNLNIIHNKIDLPIKYILFVGNRSGYKNFKFFINSIAPLLNKDDTLNIVCAGGTKFNNNELKLFELLEINSQVFQFDFNDNDISHFYKNALCFVFSSEYEGFGIPILEAMICGCPVILSNSSCFPEIAADAAIYFKQNDSEDLYNKITTLISNNNLQISLKEKGYLQVEKYSWAKTTNSFLNIFKSLLNE